MQALNFWLDIERFNSIDESFVFIKWQMFREIQLRYFQMGVLQFPEAETTADGVITSELHKYITDKLTNTVI